MRARASSAASSGLSKVPAVARREKAKSAVAVARQMHATGRSDQAIKLMVLACELDPDDAAYRALKAAWSRQASEPAAQTGPPGPPASLSPPPLTRTVAQEAVDPQEPLPVGLSPRELFAQALSRHAAGNLAGALHFGREAARLAPDELEIIDQLAAWEHARATSARTR